MEDNGNVIRCDFLQEELAKLKAASEEQERQVGELKQIIRDNAANFQQVD